MTIPNFFIVGAAKSGTSSLWQYLKKHPEVFMPINDLDKEPAYFSPLKCKRKFPQYMALFKNAKSSHKRIGEASTAYLTDPKSPNLIHTFNSKSKILIILRNPADRAYSSYCWMVQEGYEYASTFQLALKLEQKRINKLIPNFWEPEYYCDYLYFRAGLYYEQVKRYIHLFGENTLVIRFEDFVNKFPPEYKKICNFLNICEHKVKPEIFNVSQEVYSPLIQFFLRKVSTRIINYRFKHHNYRIKSKKDRDRLITIGLRNKKPKPLKPKIKKYLLRKYQENIYKLTELTGIEFDNWLK